MAVVCQLIRAVSCRKIDTVRARPVSSGERFFQCLPSMEGATSAGKSKSERGYLRARPERGPRREVRARRPRGIFNRLLGADRGKMVGVPEDPPGVGGVRPRVPRGPSLL